MTTHPSLCLHHAYTCTVALNGKNTKKEGGQESMGQGTRAASAWAIIWVQVAQHLCIKEGSVTEQIARTFLSERYMTFFLPQKCQE